jgi:hypothetical protein
MFESVLNNFPGISQNKRKTLLLSLRKQCKKDDMEEDCHSSKEKEVIDLQKVKVPRVTVPK